MNIGFNYYREETLGVVELDGDKTLEGAKNAWEMIRLAIQNDRLNAVLIRDRAEDHLKTYELLSVEKWIDQNNFPRNIKVAIVDTRPPALSSSRLSETVVRNRGWPLITVFDDEAAARKWLSHLSSD